MKRKYESIPNYPGICRILVLHKKTGQWNEPIRGARFRASRYVRSGDGKLQRRYVFCKSFQDAKAFRQREEVCRKEEGHIQSKGMTFGGLVTKWEQECLPHKDTSTQIRYRSYLQHFRFFWEMSVEAIQPGDIDRWITEIKRPEYLARGHSTRCAYEHEFSVLRGIFKFYTSRINRNYRLPFLPDHKGMLKVREKQKPKKDLTIEEFQRFLNCLQEICVESDSEVIYYLAIMQYAIYGRVQDAAALHYEDFDFARGLILVNKKVQWLRAKGHHDRIVDGSKANGGKEIPMPDLATRVFREWVMKAGIRSGLLFATNGGPISYRQIEYRYTQALKRAGLPFSATHILRHASLTEAYSAGKDILATKEVAGHRDLRSTMRYAKARQEQVAQAQKLLDAKLTSVVMGSKG